MTFDAFVGIDWSGAKGSRHRTIQIAMCRPGRAAPGIVVPPGGVWSRQAVLEWTIEAHAKGRVLVGIDFSFTLPFVDHGAYFPGEPLSPPTASELWALVDRFSDGGTDLYAGAVVAASPFAPHFRTPRMTGARFSRRHKVVEQACGQQGLGRPETVFHLIGPKQVGLGSLAGMRFLSALRRETRAIQVWPFDAVRPGVSTIVEVFPRAFLAAGGQGSTKVRSADALNEVLAAFGSEPVDLQGPVDDNAADAVVTAAALRAWVGDPGLWRPPAMDATVRHTEGWIFGVR